MDNTIKVDLISPSQAPTPSLMSWLMGFDARYLRVAQASCEKGVLMHVYFVKADASYLITGVVCDPSVKKEDIKQGGDAVDVFLEALAQIEGVARLYMMRPNEDECILINTFAPRITHGKALPNISHVAYLN